MVLIYVYRKELHDILKPSEPTIKKDLTKSLEIFVDKIVLEPVLQSSIKINAVDNIIETVAEDTINPIIEKAVDVTIDEIDTLMTVNDRKIDN
jgi:hypothetical protein